MFCNRKLKPYVSSILNFIAKFDSDLLFQLPIKIYGFHDVNINYVLILFTSVKIFFFRKNNTPWKFLKQGKVAKTDTPALTSL